MLKQGKKFAIETLRSTVSFREPFIPDDSTAAERIFFCGKGNMSAAKFHAPTVRPQKILKGAGASHIEVSRSVGWSTGSYSAWGTYLVFYESNPSAYSPLLEYDFDSLRLYYHGNKDIPAIEEENSPEQEFVPSQELVSLVDRSIAHPDAGVTRLIGEAQVANRASGVICENESELLSKIITEQVESLMTNLAKRSFYAKKPIKIIHDNRFLTDICNELIRRLGLDSYNPSPVLDRLYSEFVRFLKGTPRKRKWGTIQLRDTEVNFEFSKFAFKTIKINEINAGKWKVT